MVHGDDVTMHERHPVKSLQSVSLRRKFERARRLGGGKQILSD